MEELKGDNSGRRSGMVIYRHQLQGPLYTLSVCAQPRVDRATDTYLDRCTLFEGFVGYRSVRSDFSGTLVQRRHRYCVTIYAARGEIHRRTAVTERQGQIYSVMLNPYRTGSDSGTIGRRTLSYNNFALVVNLDLMWYG